MNINQLKGIAMGLILGFATVLCAEESTFNALMPAPRGVFDEVKAKTIASLKPGEPVVIKGKLKVIDEETPARFSFSIDPANGLLANATQVHVFSGQTSLYAQQDRQNPYLTIEPGLSTGSALGARLWIRNKLEVQIGDTEAQRQVVARVRKNLLDPADPPVIGLNVATGIGTLMPTQQLSVAGDQATSLTNSGDCPAGFDWYDEDQDGKRSASECKRTGLAVTSAGLVGIRTTNPSALLHISRVDTTANPLRIDPSLASTRPFVVTTGGRVGVATDTPDAVLKVRGLPLPTTMPIFNATNDSGDSILAAVSEGNVGIGNDKPTSVASPGNQVTTGNLDVNDVYLRSVDRWASQGGGGPRFIQPTVLNSGTGSTTPPRTWFEVSVETYGIPSSASAVILEAEGSLNGPDVDPDQHIYVGNYTSPGSTLSSYVLLHGRASGSEDQVGISGQGTFPVKNGKFYYLVSNPGFDLGWTIRIIGYYP